MEIVVRVVVKPTKDGEEPDKSFVMEAISLGIYEMSDGYLVAEVEEIDKPKPRRHFCLTCQWLREEKATGFRWCDYPLSNDVRVTFDEKCPVYVREGSTRSFFGVS